MRLSLFIGTVLGTARDLISREMGLWSDGHRSTACGSDEGCTMASNWRMGEARLGFEGSSGSASSSSKVASAGV